MHTIKVRILLPLTALLLCMPGDLSVPATPDSTDHSLRAALVNSRYADLDDSLHSSFSLMDSLRVRHWGASHAVISQVMGDMGENDCELLLLHLADGTAQVSASRRFELCGNGYSYSFDGSAFPLTDREWALGLQTTFHHGNANGAHWETFLELLRVERDTLVSILVHELESGRIELDPNDKDAGYVPVAFSETVCHPLSSQTGGFYDFQFISDTKDTVTYRWNGKAYVKPSERDE